jgi:PAT family beta-lactamase induction signal transducer AmpG
LGIGVGIGLSDGEGKRQDRRGGPPHPFVWAVLYLPFGALTGFVQIALTFLATEHGLSISEGALLNAAQMISQWLKWLWAPIVDVTLTPRRWYVISTAASALGVLGMSIVPLGPSTLGLLLAIIAAASLINSVVGMSIEAMISSCTPPDQIGRTSAWFQAGNLGGTGLGGALGLFLITSLPAPWMAGAIMGALFMACCVALRFTPFVPTHAEAGPGGALAGVKGVVRSLGKMLKTKGGVLSAILCALPIGTGAAQVVLTQANVAGFWGAGKQEVELLQGLLAGFVTTLGCFAGGWICHRVHPRTAYAGIGLAMATAAAMMAICPATVIMYIA